MSKNIISPFHKEWVTATLAAESIINLKHIIGPVNSAYLDCVTNEDQSIKYLYYQMIRMYMLLVLIMINYFLVYNIHLLMDWLK